MRCIPRGIVAVEIHRPRGDEDTNGEQKRMVPYNYPKKTWTYFLAIVTVLLARNIVLVEIHWAWGREEQLSGRGEKTFTRQNDIHT